jgi:hypothetical protein
LKKWRDNLGGKNGGKNGGKIWAGKKWRGVEKYVLVVLESEVKLINKT